MTRTRLAAENRRYDRLANQMAIAAALQKCPPSSVADQIIPWDQVQEGDLLLWDGEFRLITRLIDYGGEPLMWFDGSVIGGGVLPCGTYAAVRRYQEG